MLKKSYYYYSDYQQCSLNDIAIVMFILIGAFHFEKSVATLVIIYLNSGLQYNFRLLQAFHSTFIQHILPRATVLCTGETVLNNPQQSPCPVAHILEGRETVHIRECNYSRSISKECQGKKKWILTWQRPCPLRQRPYLFWSTWVLYHVTQDLQILKSDLWASGLLGVISEPSAQTVKRKNISSAYLLISKCKGRDGTKKVLSVAAKAWLSNTRHVWDATPSSWSGRYNQVFLFPAEPGTSFTNFLSTVLQATTVSDSGQHKR